MKKSKVMMEGNFKIIISDSNYSNEEKYNDLNNEDKNAFDNT